MENRWNHWQHPLWVFLPLFDRWCLRTSWGQNAAFGFWVKFRDIIWFLHSEKTGFLQVVRNRTPLILLLSKIRPKNPSRRRNEQRCALRLQETIFRHTGPLLMNNAESTEMSRLTELRRFPSRRTEGKWEKKASGSQGGGLIEWSSYVVSCRGRSGC